MADMMKKMGKGGMLKQAMKGMFGRGGMPDPSKMDPAEMEAAAKAMGANLPGGMGGLGGGKGMALPPGLSGLGGFGKKK
jgi:signal recognition particle subunit SRP54